MNLYVTFGQIHHHEIHGLIFDKDCVALIKCASYQHGREIAFDAFGPKFCFTYTDENFTPEILRYFPRGIIELPQL